MHDAPKIRDMKKIETENGINGFIFIIFTSVFRQASAQIFNLMAHALDTS